jgi:hypothetical protein
MSNPLTHATTGPDAESPAAVEEEEDCCPHPVMTGRTRSATAATVETAVRRGGAPIGSGAMGGLYFSGFMAPES